MSTINVDKDDHAMLAVARVPRGTAAVTPPLSRGRCTKKNGNLTLTRPNVRLAYFFTPGVLFLSRPCMVSVHHGMWADCMLTRVVPVVVMCRACACMLIDGHVRITATMRGQCKSD